MSGRSVSKKWAFADPQDIKINVTIARSPAY